MFASVVILLLSFVSTSADKCSVKQLRLKNSNIVPMASCQTAVRNEVDRSKKQGIICSNIHCLEVIHAKKDLTCTWFGQSLANLNSTCINDFSCGDNAAFMKNAMTCEDARNAEPKLIKRKKLVCAGVCKQTYDFLLTAKCNMKGICPLNIAKMYFGNPKEICQHTPIPTTTNPSTKAPEDKKKCTDAQLNALISSNKAYADAHTKCEKFTAANGGDMTKICENESCKTKIVIMASSLKCQVDADVAKMMKKCGVTSPNSTKKPEEGSNSNADSSTSTNVVSFMAMILSSVVAALV